MQQLNARKKEAVKRLSAHARGILTNNRDNATSCKEAHYQQFCEKLGGPRVSCSPKFLHSQSNGHNVIQNTRSELPHWLTGVVIGHLVS